MTKAREMGKRHSSPFNINEEDANALRHNNIRIKIPLARKTIEKEGIHLIPRGQQESLAETTDALRKQLGTRPVADILRGVGKKTQGTYKKGRSTGASYFHKPLSTSATTTGA